MTHVNFKTFQDFSLLSCGLDGSWCALYLVLEAPFCECRWLAHHGTLLPVLQSHWLLSVLLEQPASWFFVCFVWSWCSWLSRFVLLKSKCLAQSSESVLTVIREIFPEHLVYTSPLHPQSLLPSYFIYLFSSEASFITTEKKERNVFICLKVYLFFFTPSTI